MKEIGLLLQESRESQGITIAQASGALKIKKEHLCKIEDGELSDLSGGIYAIGCVKSYANWLGMNGDDISTRLKNEKSGFNVKKSPLSNEGKVSYSNSVKVSLPTKNTVMYVSVIILVLLVVWLAGGSKYYEAKSQLAVHAGSYGGFSYFPDERSRIILLPGSEVSIEMTDIYGASVRKDLTKDEIFFVPADKELYITASSPEVVDVFLDDDKNSFLGNLKDISK